MDFMNLFKKSKKSQWEKSITLLNNDSISLQDFINMNASLTVYYSTPFGENSKGETIPWIYHDDDLNMDFYPVFLSQKICSEYFKIAGRAQFLIIKGDLESALEALDVHPLLQECGVLLFDENGQLAIPPKLRVQKS